MLDHGSHCPSLKCLEKAIEWRPGRDCSCVVSGDVESQPLVQLCQMTSFLEDLHFP